MKKHILPLLTVCMYCFTLQAQDDPYQWLEEIEGKRSLEFVNAHNKTTLQKLQQVKEYEAIYNKSLEINNSTDKIAYPKVWGEFVYNFWQDKAHVRGIWRRSSKQNYMMGKPAWETLIDLDKMSAEDNVKWVFKNAVGLYPQYNLFLVSLSKGGGDAVVVREFDVSSKSFKKDGFILDEAKSDIAYVDEHTVVVGSDFGPNSMTTSGYPRQVRLWERGTPVSQAKLIYESDSTDLTGFCEVLRERNNQYLFVTRALTTTTSNTFVWLNNQLIKLDIPDDRTLINIDLSLLNNQLIIRLESDWTVNEKTYKQGSLVSLNLQELIKGKKEVSLILQPDAFTSISGIATTQSRLLVNVLSNVKSGLYAFSLQGGKWEKQKINAPDFGTITLEFANFSSDDYFFSFENFLSPTTLFSGNALNATTRSLQSLPAYFDAAKYKVEQYKARSKDGVMVPYFVVSSKEFQYNGKNPTLLTAYGGFGVPEQPYYSGITGNAWLNNGGVFVLANIRGGGEFGPLWHQQGLKEKRQHVYDDFHTVAGALIEKKITSPKHLGIFGGSNGGLLVGVAFTQRPDLYNAVVCAVPLLDMQRYNKLLAGASWMGEYGDPDIPADWAYIQKYSPYHNLRKDVRYPEVFFYTSTRDDRVHPGHARKMAAKMTDMGYPVLYYENTEGGHAGASTNEQRAQENAMRYAYLLMKLR
ncbi:MAG: S9 family peptidase [Chitinophagaceae bacterium]|nr:S9 family peptidase [Chitinophagaceae bacterium]